MTSTPIAATEPVGRAARWARQAWAVALYDFRRLSPNRHALGRHAVIAVPLLVSIVVFLYRWAAAETPFVEALVLDGTRITPTIALSELAKEFRYLNLGAVFYFSAAALFGNLYHGEIAERTLHHLFLMPVRREVTTAGKYLAGVLVLASTAVATWWLATIVRLAAHGTAGFAALLSGEGLRQLFGFSAVLVLGSLAYGALALLFGALVRSPAALAGLFWVWELLAGFLPVSFQRLTILYWLASAMPVRVQPSSALASSFEPAHAVVAALVLLGIAAGCLALAVVRVRRLQVSYGASE